MTDDSILPARPVAPREQLFPSLSICYRAVAQQEIWCMTNGGTAVRNYCELFWSDATPPGRRANLSKLINVVSSGISDAAASAYTCSLLAQHALFDCATGGSTAINPPDPMRAYPCLTILYQYYVLDGNDQCTEDSIADIRNSLAGEIFSVKLVW